MNTLSFYSFEFRQEKEIDFSVSQKDDNTWNILLISVLQYEEI